ncbi:helix-turn-helix domain-containing protein [Streptomyces sp. NPDC004435]|uniref:helix-turn-helix domain-containing protein n=1 Tax=Streptomyces sp. NPDC004435 TaxID=3364701 RepID=UPI00369D9D69
MAAKVGPSGRRLELGIQLRTLRENCPPVEPGRVKGMTRKEAIRGLKEMSEAKLARIEGGESNFRRNVGDLKALLRRYEVTDPELEDYLVELNRESPKEEWLTTHTRFLPAGMPHYLGLEAEAIGIIAYHPMLVYVLLQTEEYARALLETHRPVEDTTAESVRNKLEVRMERKHRVFHPPGREPARLRIILGEAALRIPYGGKEVMRAQYREIIRLAELDHVSIQVLPFGPGYRSTHDFAILDLGELPSRVQIDNAWGAISTTDKPREVDRFQRRFDTMVGLAFGVEKTIEFLHELAKG